MKRTAPSGFDLSRQSSPSRSVEVNAAHESERELERAPPPSGRRGLQPALLATVAPFVSGGGGVGGVGSGSGSGSSSSVSSTGNSGGTIAVGGVGGGGGGSGGGGGGGGGDGWLAGSDGESALAGSLFFS